MPTVINLASATLADSGPKMGRLGELVRAGIQVPAGFVVTAAPAPARLEDELAAQIRAAYRRLCHGAEKPVAVRSSALDEDGSRASFAGVYDSYLGVLGAEEVLRAVRDCWAGLNSMHADAYRQRLGTPASGTSMAVGVMLMAPARASGVAFTVDPVRGCDDRVLIEASIGFGEPVVQGVVTPDRIQVSDDGRILRYDTGSKQVALRYKGSGRMEHVELEPEQALAPALTAHEATRVCERVLAVEASAAQPVDCEWVLDDAGNVWIVQWRPVTAIPAGEALQWDPAEYAARYAFRSE